MTTPLKNYIQQIDSSVLGESMSNNRNRKTLKRHAQVGETIADVGLYETQHDRWARTAKRQFSKAELHNVMEYNMIEFDQNEAVNYQGKHVLVRVPQGPNGTVGIMLEGRMRMVNREDLTKLDEAVLGIKDVDTINRVMQLAGLSSKYDIAREPMLMEDATSDMFDNLIKQNASKYPNDSDAVKLYVMGALLTMISNQLSQPNAFASKAANDFISDKKQLIQMLEQGGADMVLSSQTVHNAFQKAQQANT
jgi:hypothetical protein